MSTKDLIARLRRLHIMDEVGSDNPLGREVADEIERLQRVVTEYRSTLMKIRIHLHATGRRPEVCPMMSWIDDALAEPAPGGQDAERAEGGA